MYAKDLVVTINESSATAALTAWLLNATPFAILVVDTDGRIRYSNPRAEDILTGDDGIGADGGVLRLARSRDHERLARALRTALPQQPNRPLVVLAERVANKRPYALVIVKPPGATHTHLRIVLINDTNSRIELHPEWIAALFNVTPAEARIVALIAQGMAVEDIGASLKVTAGTVRVHLRNIYRKLNVRRQSDLVSTVLGATATFSSCQATAIAASA